jgi:two-component system, cell cycle response regulator
VDDDPEVASVLTEALQRLNYDAFSVHNGTDALARCSEGGVDVVLLDVNLPDVSGYEVCKRLKADPATCDVDVVFCTGRGTLEDIEHGYQLGAFDYLTKPFNLPMVVVRVEAALRKRRMNGQLEDFEPQSFVDTAYTDSLTGLRNRRYLLERLQEEVEKAHRYDYPVSCVMFDVDDTTPVDDELGQAPLDDLLAEIALSVRHYSRTFDVVARFDGTILAALLPHSPMSNAVSYAKKILEEVENTTFADPSFPTKAQLSIGVVTCQNGSARGGDVVLGEAMRALLQAKSNGKRIYACNLDEA